MTGPTEQQTDAAGRVAAYLDERGSDLREVLRQLDEARKFWEIWNDRAMELRAEVERLKKRIQDDAEGIAIVADVRRFIICINTDMTMSLCCDDHDGDISLDHYGANFADLLKAAIDHLREAHDADTILS